MIKVNIMVFWNVTSCNLVGTGMYQITLRNTTARTSCVINLSELLSAIFINSFQFKMFSGSLHV